MDVSAQKDIIEDTHTVEQREILKCSGDAHTGYFVRFGAGDIGAIQQYLSGVGRVKPGDGIGKGGFSATVGANKAEYFALVDGLVDAGDGDKAPKAPFDISALQYRSIGLHPAS